MIDALLFTSLALIVFGIAGLWRAIKRSKQTNPHLQRAIWRAVQREQRRNR